VVRCVPDVFAQGFVRFQRRADAERAKAEMNRRVVGTRPIRIGWGDNAVQKHVVHVTLHSLHPTGALNLSEAHLKAAFEPYGAVTHITMPRYMNNRLKGYAFVHFPETMDGEKCAAVAVQAMNESKIGDVQLRCSFGKRQVYRHKLQRFEQAAAAAAAAAAG
jgi:RNA recognition motif-containing protein